MVRRSRSAIWLSALGIGLFQVLGSVGAANNQPDRKGIDALAVVLLLIGPAALAVRDRWPVVAVAVTIAAAELYLGAGYPYGPIFLSVVVALVYAVITGNRQRTWIVAGIGYFGFIAASVLDPRRHSSVASLHFLLVAGWLAGVLATAEVVRVRRDQVIDRRRAAAEEEQRRVGEQRLELAQELHDVLAHNISLINVQASVALHLLDEQPDQARPALTSIKDASHDALQELRTALDVLRRGEAAPRTPAPTLADLPALLDNVRASGLDIDFQQHGEPAPLSATTELAAYRIVQEALTNITRHAHAHHARVRLGYDDGVRIEVTDDGVGGTAAPGKGITGMRERAEALGGTVEAGPRQHGGFRVTAHLPATARAAAP
jgi:signal transduction histidine kinase